MDKVVAERVRRRAELIELARTYVRSLGQRLPLVAAAVVGSVARGDFNVWSDVDVVVVAESLPERLPERLALLTRDAPPGVQPVGFTPQEFRWALDKRNPLARAVREEGVVILGDEALRALAD
ncbi:MAG TPA: nucleotidyltransferase domain-containing protein [Actinomycetota bacterium]|nr:nucleotidyltransferase domain-containing protein [Actinomycetota bacterium]